MNAFASGNDTIEVESRTFKTDEDPVNTIEDLFVSTCSYDVVAIVISL